MRTRWTETFLPYICAGVILLGSFSLLFFLGSSSPSLVTQDDGYYHIRAALAYCTDTPKVYQPVFSTMSTMPADLYLGYHMLMCPFLSIFPGNDYTSLATGAKLFTALFSATFLLVFFAVAKKYLKSRPWFTDTDPALYALGATIFLFVASPNFFDRLLVMRPNLLAILAITLALYYTLRKNHIGLFAIGALLPLFYSVSFMILIPAGVYAMARIIYDRKFSIRYFIPLGISLSGLISGILLHPEPYNYVYNAYFVHLTVALHHFGGSMREVVELYPPIISWFDYLWIIMFFILFVTNFGWIIINSSLRKTMPFERFYLLLGTGMLLVGFTQISRFAEYFFPFLAFFAAEFLTFLLVAEKEATGTDPIERTPHRKKNQIAALLCIVVLAIFSVYTYRLRPSLATNPPLDYYQGAAEYMKDNSKEGDIIFLQSLNPYPRLAFFNEKNRYVIGLEQMFMYAYNPAIYWLYYHATNGDPICDQRICMGPDTDLYDTIKNDFHATFVFQGPIDRRGDGVPEEKIFYDRLAKDPRFMRVYTDAKYPEISVYRLSL